MSFSLTSADDDYYDNFITTDITQLYAGNYNDYKNKETGAAEKSLMCSKYLLSDLNKQLTDCSI